jgi:hypothetical protein
MRRASRGVGELKKDCRPALHTTTTKSLKIFFSKIIEKDTFRRFIHLIQNKIQTTFLSGLGLSLSLLLPTWIRQKLGLGFILTFLWRSGISLYKFADMNHC